ncbi:MAG: chitobiase/beta-hexosaminidase C-terminal domain-containing protein [Muribaculaceae bacterium]|nr:chitobiase/beta-hexosaminidase C-terminal domain-containing protein [Muribaculaceae bacterium]
MKKFLFTLAALLMAGSMFADNYFYMDNITLTKDEAANGCAKVVNVRAHFDEAVSAWQAEFTLPEGVTIGAQAKGSDLTLTFLGMFEDEETLETYYQETTYTPDLATNNDKTKVIVSVYTTKEYDDAHNAYGVCWRPRDYDQMWRVRLVFPAGFKGGDIVLHSEASCGVNVMPPYTPCTLNPIDKTTEVRIKADKPEIAVTGDDYAKTVTITAEEGATIYYSTNGVDYQVYTDPIEFNEEGTYKVYAYAEGPGEGVERKSKSDVAESDEFTIKKKETPAPEPKITMSDNYVVTAAVEDDDPDAPHTVKLYLVEGENRTEVANPYPITQTYDDQSYTFVAVTIANDGESDDTECDPVTFNVPGKEKDYAPTPTITKIENGTKVEATVEGNYEVVLMLEGEDGVYAPCANPYTLPAQTYEEQTLNFKAYTKKNGEYYDSPETEVFTVIIPKLTKKTAQKPTIAGTNLTNTTKDIVITPDPNTDGTLMVEANPAAPGRAAAQTMTYERKDADYYVHVKAWTTEGDTYLASEVAEEDILIPAKPAPKVYEVDDPTISVDNSDPTKTVITIEATEGDLTYNIDAEEGVAYTVEEVDGKVIITVVNGDETAFVNVTATTTLTEVPAGYDEVKDGEAEKNVEIPAKPEQTAAPTIDVSFGGEDGAHYANVTFVNNDAKPAVIEYSLDGGKTWNTYTPGVPVVINTYGETTVLARAKAEGKTVSENAERTFTLNDDATSVNELVNGKTVAGVRYFNMAGQEMQEANGITIVVTTYTDGTTSAVKVIK